jgi:hypothetical protein
MVMAINLQRLKQRLERNDNKEYVSQYNDFWRWKVSIEKDGKAHILDPEHITQASETLLNILSGGEWMTYWGVKCDFGKVLPDALIKMADAYDRIRQHSLLQLDNIRADDLEFIWHELGRVKTCDGARRDDGVYYIIAVCKPLMFLWGQTLGFDSQNQKKIPKDHDLEFVSGVPRRCQWHFKEWIRLLHGFRRELLNAPDVVHYCRERADTKLQSPNIVPFGRFLDLLYYERGTADQCSPRRSG